LRYFESNNKAAVQFLQKRRKYSFHMNILNKFLRELKRNMLYPNNHI